MKFKLAANAEIDLLTKSEVVDVVQSHMRDALGGVLYRSVLAKPFVSDGTSIVTFELKVREGRMWSVRAVSVNKSDTDVVKLWKDSVTPGSYICSVADDGQKGNYVSFTNGALVLQSGETLVVQALTATGNSYCSIRVKEVPAGHDFKL